MSKTVQDIYDGMPAAQKDFAALCVAAAVDDVDIPEEIDAQKNYADLSTEYKNLIDFIVGVAISNPSSVAHSDVLENYLIHHGVKGQKWGVRRQRDSSGKPSLSSTTTKEQRQSARAAVKTGTATLGQAHVAALKSRGHRIVNAVLGDKRYWKTALEIAGFTAVGVGAAMLLPGLLPAGLLTSLGAHAAGTAGVAGHVLVNGHLTTTASIGKDVAKAYGIGAVTTAAGVASQVAGLTNLGRAVRGNARINKSYEALGAHISGTQKSGNERVRKTLSRNGSISPKLIRHDDFLDEDVLAHHGIKGMKWGIRRAQAVLDRAAGRKAGTNDGVSPHINPKKAPPGTILVVKDHVTGEERHLIKTDSGSYHETHLSEEARRFIELRQKPQHEMSNKELSDLLSRARLVGEYDKMFAPKPNAELKQTVDKLELQKKYSEIHSAMNPSRKKKVASLVVSAASAYVSFKKADKQLDGALSKKLDSAMSIYKQANGSHVPKHRLAYTPPPEKKKKKKNQEG